ncbi:MAG: hypothetical protein CHACPFDD_02392 [Phycisphaerae bacterium]|nr:hypothetical protein [Phycisphaerae bacterium]
MPESESHDAASPPESLSRARLIAASLEFIAILLGLASIVWAGQRLWTISQAQPIDTGAALSSVLGLAAALAGSVLLWGVGEAVRRIDALHRALSSYLGQPRELRVISSGEPQKGSASDRLLAELVTLTREARDISLLTEAQRAARLDMQGEALAHRMEQEVPELLRGHNWFEASKRVEAARQRFPGMPIWDSLHAQIETVRAQVEAKDVDGATRQIDELVALGAWDRVQDVLNDLLERHPRSAGALDLARRIRAQRDKAESEIRMRLMAQAQGHADRREWQEALSAARALIQRFPRSAESEALRQQLPTLEANSEIRARQQMEANYRQHVAQRRFADALRLAQQIIERYPSSPQAEALREQIPKLEERAGIVRQWA